MPIVGMNLMDGRLRSTIVPTVAVVENVTNDPAVRRPDP
jgi:hypothetical protein